LQFQNTLEELREDNETLTEKVEIMENKPFSPRKGWNDQFLDYSG
jgi:hypothetical protein